MQAQGCSPKKVVIRPPWNNSRPGGCKSMKRKKCPYGGHTLASRPCGSVWPRLHLVTSGRHSLYAYWSTAGVRFDRRTLYSLQNSDHMFSTKANSGHTPYGTVWSRLRTPLHAGQRMFTAFQNCPRDMFMWSLRVKSLTESTGCEIHSTSQNVIADSEITRVSQQMIDR